MWGDNDQVGLRQARDPGRRDRPCLGGCQRPRRRDRPAGPHRPESGALGKINDVDALIGWICTARLAFLQRLKGWSTFGKGWGRRVAEVRTVAQGWAHGAALADVPLPEPVAPVRGKASQVAVSKTAEGKAGIGTALGALGSAASEASEASGQLAPFTEILTVVKWIFVGLTVVSVAAGLYLAISKINAQPELA